MDSYQVTEQMTGPMSPASAPLFKRFDEKLVQGVRFNYEDKGYAVKGGKTRKFAVISRYNRSLVGYIKYYAQWRQYVLFPLYGVLNKDCLREIADYCEGVSAAHRKGETFPAS